MCHFGENSRTVRTGLIVLFLAVCFFLFWSPVQAQGVNIRLDCKSLYFLPLEPQKERGLSISTSPPLLKSNRLRFQRKVDVNYDQGYAVIYDKIGSYSIYHPLSFDLPSYIKTNNDLAYQQGWLKTLDSSLKKQQSDKGGGLLNFEIPVKFPKLVTKIIGEGGPGLKVTGSRKIVFSGRSSWQEGLKNTATSRQSKFPSLNMEQISKFTITGNVGTRVSVRVDQDSKRQTDLENTMHLKYTGDEDGIVQSIEAGNTNLSMRSGLMGYSQNVQGLFGIKSQVKFGGLDMTMIASQEKGSTQKAEFSAGAQTDTIKIRDYEYKPLTFFYLGQDSLLGHLKNDFQVGDSIITFDLYKSNSAITMNSDFRYGIAYADLENPDSSGEEVEYRRFELMDPSEYELYRNKTKDTQDGLITYTLPYIELNNNLYSTDILAVYYEVLRGDSIIKVGNLEYSSGTTDSDTTYLLKLIKPQYLKPQYITWEYEWRNVYSLRSRNIDPDGLKIDIYKAVKGDEDPNRNLNQQDGVRYLEILGLDRYNTRGEREPDGVFDQSQVILGKGYLLFPQRHPFASDFSFSSNPDDTLKEKVREIYTSNVSQDITDASKYYIYVESAARKAEYYLGHAPIIEGSEVVTLSGRRLIRGKDYDIIYEIGQLRFLTDEALDPTARVSVDYEYAPLFMPERKSLFGVQGKYDFGENLNFDCVALYKSEKSGEERPRVGEEPTRNFAWGGALSFKKSSALLTNLADALPLLETDSPSAINFTFQGGGSMPNPNTKNRAYIDDFEASLDYTDLGIRRGIWSISSLPDESFQRGRMYWYNPYDQVRVDEIWPNKEAWRTENRTNVLNIVFLPDRPQAPVDTLKGDKVCNGIMRAFSQGNYDQSRKRFLEVWVKGEVGTLHVDLGQISEDVIPNGELDTEDQEENGQRDGILDPDEDTGLDGLMNSAEPGYDASTNPDPNGDDFEYRSEDRSLRYDYTRINGTEGNIDDPDIGRRPDTEDINYNGIVDVTNNYFEYTIDLSSPDWVEGTYNNGWKLYRIPLKDATTPYYGTVGAPDWNTIQFSRIWVTAPDSCLIQIASIQLVGNKWLNTGISEPQPKEKKISGKEHQGSFIGGADYLSWLEQKPEEVESKFEIFVTNTHENADYDPPPKVAGVLDRKTQVREKEQSLVLRFEELKPYHSGSAHRILYSTEDYTNYRYMKMWIHGSENTSDILFFFRMGLDSTNYYEYYTEVTPGWNEMLIDFNQITGLKMKRDENSNIITEGNYRVKGGPSLSRIKWFSCGVENLNPDSSISDEVWLDELIVTDIRRIPGLAGQASLSLNLADFTSFNLSFSKKDSEFRNLVTKKGTGINQTSIGIRNDINLDKLLPPTWGFKLPLKLSWSKSTSIPRLKTGSDIVIPPDLRDFEATETVTRTLRFSESFSKNTKNWLLNLTLRRITTGFSYQDNSSRSPLKPVDESRNYDWNMGYSVSPGREPSFPILSWLKLPLLPSSLTGTRLYLFPTVIKFGGKVHGSESYSENKAGNVTETYVKDFNGDATISVKPINALDAKYNFNTTRDIRDKEDLKFSFNPKGLKLGQEIKRGQSFTINYNPTLFQFLTHKFSFSSNYSENSDPQKYLGTRTAGNSSTRSIDLQLNLNTLLGRSVPARTDTSGSGFKISPLSWMRFLISRIDPISGGYTRTTKSSVSGLLDRPSLVYQFGFTSDPEAGRKIDPNRTASDASSVRKGYDLRTGAKITNQIKATLRYSRDLSWTASSSKPVKKISETFPDLTLTWSGLEKIRFFSKLVSNLSYKFGYSRKVDKSEELKTKNPLSKDTDKRFSPLAYLTFSWKNGIKSTLDINKRITERKDLKQTGGSQSVTLSYETTYKISSSYSFSAPQGIKFPFLRKVKFQSNMNISVDITKKSSKQKTSVQGRPFNVKGSDTQFILGARGGYSFSSQVTGGLMLKWTDTHDKKTGAKGHTREVGIWIELKF
jgi:hypothetical protein